MPLLLLDIIFNVPPHKSPLSSDLEARKFTLVGESNDCARMNSKHFPNLICIEDIINHE